MKFDEHAIDTIFGALMLIMSCFVSSGMVILIEHNLIEDEVAGIDMERRYDLCLLSTIHIERKVMNTTVMETIQLIDYLALERNPHEMSKEPTIENATANQIMELFNFYFSRYHFWQLSFMFDGKKMAVIAESGNHAEAVDAIFLERTIQISGSHSYSLALIIEI